MSLSEGNVQRQRRRKTKHQKVKPMADEVIEIQPLQPRSMSALAVGLGLQARPMQCNSNTTMFERQPGYHRDGWHFRGTAAPSADCRYRQRRYIALCERDDGDRNYAKNKPSFLKVATISNSSTTTGPSSAAVCTSPFQDAQEQRLGPSAAGASARMQKSSTRLYQGLWRVGQEPQGARRQTAMISWGNHLHSQRHQRSQPGGYRELRVPGSELKKLHPHLQRAAFPGIDQERLDGRLGRCTSTRSNSTRRVRMVEQRFRVG